jgi:cytochrome c
MQGLVKVASMGLSVFALAALSACSGGEKSDSADTAADTSAANTATAEAPAANSATAAVTYASLTGDATKGEKVFLQCKTCHVLDAGVNKVGPSLNGIIGRAAGQVAGFNYSEANKNSGLTWTEEQLFTYLENPQKTIPGTKMAFAGLKQPQDRADVIAYLKTAAK